MKYLQSFAYGNHSVHFNQDNTDIFVDATQMAKIFGKRVNDFLINSNTKAFIKILELKTGIPVFKVIKGRKNPGTWMHRNLALKFAAWLNPDFEVWIYGVIDKILFGNLKEIEVSIQGSAIRKNRIESLKQSLRVNEHFQELERLQLEERQAVYKRSSEIKKQLQFFS